MGGQKLVNQIAMRAVDLEDIKARRIGPSGSISPTLHQILDFRNRQRTGRRIAPIVPVAGGYQFLIRPVIDIRERIERVATLPWPVTPGLATAMAELDAGNRPVPADEIRKPPEMLRAGRKPCPSHITVMAAGAISVEPLAKFLSPGSGEPGSVG